jgi:hypothetical protein
MKEEEEKKRQRMSRIAKIKYMEEKETLQKKSYTSFGKLILADESTAPVYSFGAGNRIDLTGKKFTPGPIYDITDKYKYNEASKWKIGTGERPPIYKGEKFEYYDHIYEDKYDFTKSPKKWQKTKGGAMSLEPRIKYDFREGVPGPGRYEPNIKPIKQKAPAYYLGEKSNYNSLNLQIGTNDLVGPGKYGVENSKKTSRHTDSPKWTMGKDVRKGPGSKTWTKNETYHLYSSVGAQIMSMKTSEPQLSLGKSNRDKDRKLGMFPAMMSKQATKVRIDHPKIY